MAGTTSLWYASADPFRFPWLRSGPLHLPRQTGLFLSQPEGLRIPAKALSVCSRLPPGRHFSPRKWTCQLGGVADHCRNDLLSCHIDHSLCLNVNALCIAFVLYLGSGLQLALVNTPNSSNSFTALSVTRAGIASTIERRLGSLSVRLPLPTPQNSRFH